MPTWQEIAAPGEVIESRMEWDREIGLTMVIDNGLGVAASQDVLSVAGRWIDHWKLSFGTSALMPEEVLKEKLALFSKAGILSFPGGTLFESAVFHGHDEDYFDKAAALGFTAVEISDGTLDLSASRRLSSIKAALAAGLTVISEVGKKDPLGQPTPRQLAEQALMDLEGGARWVVVEGRESGRSVGVFNNTGGVNMEAVETIAPSRWGSRGPVGVGGAQQEPAGHIHPTVRTQRESGQHRPESGAGVGGPPCQPTV